MSDILEVGQCTIVPGDNLETLRLMPDESIQCCVTSPPYDELRTYKGYAWDFEGLAAEITRVLCTGGVLCWNVGDSVKNGSETLTSAKQKIHFAEVCDLRVHDTMIYEKLNFGHPEKVRYHQLFEYVYVLSKGAPRAFNPLKDKPNTYAGTQTWGKNTVREPGGEMTERKKNTIAEFGMRGNVWRGKTSGQERSTAGSLHPAAMPEWLAGDLIFSWSNPGDMVLDPFGGSGTTGLMANRLERRSLMLELSPEYCSLSADRLTKDLEKQLG